MIFNLRKITEKNRAYKKFSAIAKRPVFMAVGTFFVAFIALRIFFAVLPYKELKAFEQRTVSTRIYDRNGLLLQIIPLNNGLRREYVSYRKIPRNVRKIFMRSEDRRFYFHPGVDPFSVLRASVQNGISGKKVSGASTITMQLARMVSPSCGRTFTAKIYDFSSFTFKLTHNYRKTD